MASRPILSASPKSRLTVRENCDHRAKSMMASRKDLEGVIEEISSLTQVQRSRFLPSASNRRRASRTHKQYDSHAVRASGILTNGMTSGLSSPSQPWFKLKVPDPDLMKFFATKRWLEAVQRVVADFLNSTNYYGAAKAGYGELGLFGTESCFMSAHWKHGMVCYPLQFGEYWISLSDALKPDALLRQSPMSIRQIVQRFVADSFDSSVLHWDRVSPRMKSAWDNSRYEESFEILHLVEPNPAWDPVRYDTAGKPWRSVYWDPKDDHKDRLLQAGGDQEQPFWAARWDIDGSDPYGRGPGWNALADLRTLQAQARRKGQATDYVVRPALMGSGTTKLNLNAGAYNHVPTSDQATVKEIWRVDPRSIEILGKDVDVLRAKVDDHFFVNLFMAITNMEGVQPRNIEEIVSRNEEKLTQLGPVIERVNEEKLEVGLDRAFGICARKGMLPPAPPELENMELQVDFISTLARAQRAVGLSVVERSLGVIGGMAKSRPDVLDNLDFDAVATDYWERSGAPATGLRDPKARDRIRAARQQAEAAAQARESAPAFQQAAQGAELLARTDIRDGSETALDALLGGRG